MYDYNSLYGVIKRGLEVPIILVIYSFQGNSLNLHWTGHTGADCINSALQTFQPIIERVKGGIPQCHIRAMHHVAFKKYGLMTLSLTEICILQHPY